MSAEYVIAAHGKRLHIGVEQNNTTIRRPLCGQLSPDGWFLFSAWGRMLGRNVTQVCSGCVRESRWIAALAASTEER